MTLETERGAVAAHIQQKTVGRAMYPVAGKAIAILDRGVDDLFLSHGLMALVAEVRDLGGEGEGLLPLDGVFTPRFLVAGEAIAILDGSVGRLAAFIRGMAVGSDTGVGGNGNG
jgi:hypothetical protein